MDYIEQTGDWTAQERLEWVRTYKNIIDSKKKCCDNCAFFSPMDERDEDGLCLKNVATDLSGQYILGSDTFYCSYHKLKFNDE